MALIHEFVSCTAVVLIHLAQPATQTPPADTPAPTHAEPTAEQLLRELKRQQPASYPILPATAGPDGDWPPSRNLLPEGTPIVKHVGRLTWDEPWWVFAFESSDGQPPTRVLPNTNLEVMVTASASTTASLRFLVSGEMTVFEDRNYFLVQFATRLLHDPEHSSVRGNADGESARSAHPAGNDSTVPESDTDETASTLTDASAEDVLKIMRKQRLEQRTVLAEEPQTPKRIRAIDPAAPPPIPEGTPVVSRPGRLVRQGDWWTFVFESDHLDRPEPPLKLLPNQTLELMARSTTRGEPGLVFLLSGEVTAFDAENYLLPHMAVRRTDTGNFRR
ncbi:MAG: hypothetical protein PVI86_04695 [Phycisphaerae bacterium]|jgi:hypothetical protein